MTYTIVIPGIARGKQRPRATRTGRVYTPQQTVNAEAWIKQCAIQQVGALRLDGALSLQMTIVVAIPASWSKRKKAEAAANILRPTCRPDLDNAAKLCADSLNGIVWRDDAQIVEMQLAKIYGETAQTVLTVRELGHLLREKAA